MGLLDSRVLYNKSWEEVSRENLSEEELNNIEEIRVVPAQYGKSARVSTPRGYCFYSLSRECADLPVDTILEKDKCMIVHLKRGMDQETDKLLYLG